MHVVNVTLQIFRHVSSVIAVDTFEIFLFTALPFNVSIDTGNVLKKFVAVGAEKAKFRFTLTALVGDEAAHNTTLTVIIEGVVAGVTAEFYFLVVHC